MRRALLALVVVLAAWSGTAAAGPRAECGVPRAPADTDPQLSRDGSYLLFTRREAGCPLRSSVWRSDLAGNHLLRVVAPTRLLGRVAWRFDGNLGVTQTLRQRTLILSPDGQILQTVALVNPFWAPDPDRAAFVDGSQIRVWPGGETIGRGDNAVSAPDWSPDGGEIAYSRVVGGARRSELVVAPVNGAPGASDRPQTERVVFTSSRLGQPAWSPDGAAIAFVGGRPQRLFVITPDGDTMTDATPGFARVGDLPAWSTDGRLAFAGKRGGRWSLYVVRADGTGLRRLAQPLAAPNAPLSWFPENFGIAFEGSTRACRRVGIFTARMHGGAERLTNRCR